jgi:amidase
MYHDRPGLAQSATVRASTADLRIDLAPPQTPDILELGACALSDLIASRGISCVVLEASSRCANFCRAMDRLFEAHDFLALPTAQCFPFDARVRWPKQVGGQCMDSYHRWTEVVSYATLAGCPAINVPAGFSAQGLPMGLQILAPCHRDLACLELAHAYEQATSWSAARPSKTSYHEEELTDGCVCA